MSASSACKPRASSLGCEERWTSCSIPYGTRVAIAARGLDMKLSTFFIGFISLFCSCLWAFAPCVLWVPRGSLCRYMIDAELQREIWTSVFTTGVIEAAPVGDSLFRHVSSHIGWLTYSARVLAVACLSTLSGPVIEPY
jgi:hypothetical protein